MSLSHTMIFAFLLLALLGSALGNQAARNHQQKLKQRRAAVELTMSLVPSSPIPAQCIPNDGQTLCRFNADCCSGLCSTWLFTNVTCIDNVPQNHQSDSMALGPVYPDFVPTKFAGMARWQDKVAVVTGAASGIGFATAKRLCNEGMIVVGADINDAGVKKVADFCPQGRYFSFTVDLRNEAEIVALFQYVRQTVKRVDVVVNNAGITRFTSVANVSTEAIQSTFALNTIAPMLCVREALSIMRELNITTGYMLFTNSIHGNEVQQASGDYVQQFYIYEASKHALVVLRQGLREELRANGSNIRVGEVMPPSVVTNIPESHIPRDVNNPDFERQVFTAEGKGLSGIARLSPDDIAEAFVYMLAAPERMDVGSILIYNNNPMPKYF